MAYRIWAVERNNATIRASTKGTMMPIIYVLVDAAVLYSVTLVTALVCYARSNNGDFVIVDMTMPIISIAFYMVLIRVAINRQHNYLPNIRATARTGQNNLQIYPMDVHISQFMPSDSTSAYGMRNKHQSGKPPTWTLVE